MVCNDAPKWVDWRKWEEVRSICMKTVRSLTHQSDESARDLASSFVLKVMCMRRAQKAQWPFNEDTANWLSERAIRHVRTELERDRYDKKRFVPGRRKGGQAENEVLYDLPDKKPGPEYFAMIKVILYTILREIDTEKPAARSVFLNRFLRERPFTDMAKATGKTENALWQLCMRVTGRLKAHLAGEGLTEEQIRDLLHDIDTHRSGR